LTPDGVRVDASWLGITAGLDAGLARELAARCEQLGYRSLWSNDEPAARGLDTLAQFSAATAKVELGVGVLPLHRYQPARIAAEIDRLALDPARLWIGIGSGALSPQVDPLRRAVAELRTLLPEATRIMLAAMRPHLCRLGGSIADGVLLNWMLPDQAARAREWVREGASESGRTPPVLASQKLCSHVVMSSRVRNSVESWRRYAAACAARFTETRCSSAHARTWAGWPAPAYRGGG
jgi:alkanesulfonate monooxygenase SsuD/methylene tetrahydromethanopterin reductase-like flavin-dependent oxidoreductase (luciferase family)